MALEDKALDASGQIAQLHAAVFAGEGQALAVGRNGQGEDRLRLEGMRLGVSHFGQLFAIGHVPNFHAAFSTAHGQTFAIGGEGRGINRGHVGSEVIAHLAGSRIPQAHDTVRAGSGSCQCLAIGRIGQPEEHAARTWQRLTLLAVRGIP